MPKIITWEPGMVLDPGVYRSVPAHVYHALRYASNSRLGHLVPPSTPAHLKAYLDEPPKDKKVWKEGRVLHACVLEPQRYSEEYRLAEQCIATTTKGARCSKAGAYPVVGGGDVCSTHIDGGWQIDDEVVLVSEKDDMMARRCRQRFEAHPLAGGFLNVHDAEYELTIIWDQSVLDEVTGEVVVVRCKARVDWYSESFMGGVPMDLKGARDASEREFRSQAFYNGYLRQSVLYRLALRAVGLPAQTFAAVAQEKESPYELMVYRLGDAATGPLPAPGEKPQHVAKTVFATLRLWAWCEKTGLYPGYPEVVTDLTTDEWAWSAMEDQASRINDFLKGKAA